MSSSRVVVVTCKKLESGVCCEWSQVTNLQDLLLAKGRVTAKGSQPSFFRKRNKDSVLYVSGRQFFGLKMSALCLPCSNSSGRSGGRSSAPATRACNSSSCFPSGRKMSNRF